MGLKKNVSRVSAFLGWHKVILTVGMNEKATYPMVPVVAIAAEIKMAKAGRRSTFRGQSGRWKSGPRCVELYLWITWPVQAVAAMPVAMIKTASNSRLQRSHFARVR